MCGPQIHSNFREPSTVSRHNPLIPHLGHDKISRLTTIIVKLPSPYH